MLALSINMLTRTFHWWSFSCHSSVEFVLSGGPTIDLHNFPKWVSRRQRCRLYTMRWRPPKQTTDDTTDSKWRRHFQWKHFGLAVSTGSYGRLFDACWRWYCQSRSCNFDLLTVNMLANLFCPASRGKILTITMVWGGSVSFVMTILFFPVEEQTNPSNCWTNASERLQASTADCAKMKMSSAKRKSSNVGPPSIKLKPIFPTSALLFALLIATPHKTNVDLARTPPVILQFLHCPMSPTNSPYCPKYTHCNIHTRWSGIPSSTRAPPNAGPIARSNAFDKSKLMIHTGIPTASVFSNIKLAVTRCFSGRRPGRSPCYSSGRPASKKYSNRRNKNYAHVSYNKQMLAICLRSAGCNCHVFSATCWTTFCTMIRAVPQVIKHYLTLLFKASKRPRISWVQNFSTKTPISSSCEGSSGAMLVNNGSTLDSNNSVAV